MTSPKTSKAKLRAAVIPLLNSGVSEQTLRDFIDLVNEVRSSLSPTQVNNVFKAIERCDTAVAFGRGHQSITPCTRRGPHTQHSNRQGLEWSEADITTQTYQTVREPDKKYRLAFSDEGWY